MKFKPGDLIHNKLNIKHFYTGCVLDVEKDRYRILWTYRGFDRRDLYIGSYHKGEVDPHDVLITDIFCNEFNEK